MGNSFFLISGSFYDSDQRLQRHGKLLINFDFTDVETGGPWRARREAATDDHFPIVMRCDNMLGSFVPDSGEAERIGITIEPS